MTSLSELQVDHVVLEARDMRAQMLRATALSLGEFLFKRLPEALRRANQRRRTLAALEKLDPRVLEDIGLTAGNLRRAAFAAADHAYDQEKRGVTRPTFLTSAQAINSAFKADPSAQNDSGKAGKPRQVA